MSQADDPDLRSVSPLFDMLDLVYMVEFMFKGGPEAPDMGDADLNGSGGIPNIADLTYLVRHLFSGGPAPVPRP